jgi:alkyl hydroperoxide reductase subunit AhpC
MAKYLVSIVVSNGYDFEIDAPTEKEAIEKAKEEFQVENADILESRLFRCDFVDAFADQIEN